jgi:hypothetical protein
MTPKVLWEVVREVASRAGIEKLAPHDLRRTCAWVCHLAGGELDQIQFLLGHVSIQTLSATSGASRSSAMRSMTVWASSPKRTDRRNSGAAGLPAPWRLIVNHHPTNGEWAPLSRGGRRLILTRAGPPIHVSVLVDAPARIPAVRFYCCPSPFVNSLRSMAFASAR